MVSNKLTSHTVLRYSIVWLCKEESSEESSETSHASLTARMGIRPFALSFLLLF